MKAKASVMYDKLSGKVGNIVNKQGLYNLFISEYNRSKPVLTARALSHKAIFTTLCYIWTHLDISERILYNTYRHNFPQIDKYGVTYYLNPFQLFVLINLPLFRYNNTNVSCPVNPVFLTKPDFSLSPYYYNTQNCILTNNNDFDSYHFYDFYAGKPSNIPVNPDYRTMKYLVSYYIHQHDTINIGQQIHAVFNPNTDYYNNITLAIIMRNYYTGHWSLPIYCNITIELL
jgi:hypothetical protein